MRLAPAIEEFVRYKQALGNSYVTPVPRAESFSQTNRECRIPRTPFTPRRHIPVRTGWQSHERLVSPVFGARLFLSIRDYPRVHAAQNTPSSIPDRPPTAAFRPLHLFN